MTTAHHLDSWTPEQFSVLEQSILVARHKLHETGLFTDEALAKLMNKNLMSLMGDKKYNYSVILCQELMGVINR